jgi:hypothetical protein
VRPQHLVDIRLADASAEPLRALELTTPRIDSQTPCPTCRQPLIFDEVWGWLHTRQPTAARCAQPRPQTVPVSGR